MERCALIVLGGGLRDWVRLSVLERLYRVATFSVLDGPSVSLIYSQTCKSPPVSNRS